MKPSIKTLLDKFPNGSRFILAILLYGLALLFSTFLNTGVVKEYFPYTAAIFLGMSTWFLYKIDNKSLKAIGFNLNLKNLSFLPLGLIIGAIALLAAKYARCLYTGESFVISESINYVTIINSLYFILPTVAVEEFLFRGYLFKKTIELSNVVIANIVFSLLFMSIHVLDDSVMQNTGQMIMLIMAIPIGHLFFATGLLKSKTIFFPIGLHLGNNWSSRHLVTNMDSGDSIFYTINQVDFNTWPSFIGFILLFNGVFLFFTFLIWKWDSIPFFLSKKVEM